jgi:hypothetical protein
MSLHVSRSNLQSHGTGDCLSLNDRQVACPTKSFSAGTTRFPRETRGHDILRGPLYSIEISPSPFPLPPRERVSPSSLDGRTLGGG